MMVLCERNTNEEIDQQYSIPKHIKQNLQYKHDIQWWNRGNNGI